MYMTWRTNLTKSITWFAIRDHPSIHDLKSWPFPQITLNIEFSITIMEYQTYSWDYSQRVENVMHCSKKIYTEMNGQESVAYRPNYLRNASSVRKGNRWTSEEPSSKFLCSRRLVGRFQVERAALPTNSVVVVPSPHRCCSSSSSSQAPQSPLSTALFPSHRITCRCRAVAALRAAVLP